MKYFVVFGLVTLLTGCDVGYVTQTDRIIKHIKDCEAIGKVAQLRGNSQSNAGHELLPYGCKERLGGIQ